MRREDGETAVVPRQRPPPSQPRLMKNQGRGTGGGSAWARGLPQFEPQAVGSPKNNKGCYGCFSYSGCGSPWPCAVWHVTQTFGINS